MKPSIKLGARLSLRPPRKELLRFRKSGSFRDSGVEQPGQGHVDAQSQSLAKPDNRVRLSTFWTPTSKLSSQDTGYDAVELLTRAGFIRRTHAGVIQLLPLAWRVQTKIEQLLDLQMRKVGASKISLSTFSSEALWERSGRLEGDTAELFKVQDRRGNRFLLSPTHEEEVTALVAGLTTSYRTLPLRLYQITRKYRDERRPRGGLLRAREFVMKDLYTFDVDKAAALETYESVRAAYSSFFDMIKVPYRIAEADSGSIGGDLSHEYHIISNTGEDHLVTCSDCSYAANIEVLPDLTAPEVCPKCGSNELRTTKSIELGHAFHLGTRYSAPLGATVDNRDGVRVPLEMGCFGIGVTRMIAAIAAKLRDRRGLNWPSHIAPFQAVIIPAVDELHQTAAYLYDDLRTVRFGSAWNCEAILDDRDVPLAWKLKDADLIGYPIVVIVGRQWVERRLLEVHCRRLNLVQMTSKFEMKGQIGKLLNEL